MSVPERRSRWDLGATAWGVIFLLFGVGFLLEATNVWDLRPEVIWPSMLIGLGVAVVLGGRSGT